MNHVLLLLIRKPTDALIDQMKTKRKETLEFKLNMQVKTFSFSPTMNLVEERKRLLALTSIEATNSVFNITDENSRFSVTTPNHRNSENCEELINKLNKLLELRSQNDMELHVKEVEKSGTRIEIGNSGYNSSSFDHFKREILAEMRRAKEKDLEDMVYWMQLTYDEIVDKLDVKYIA